MSALLQSLRQAEIHAAQARECIQAAHTVACGPGSGLAEMVTLDLIGVARGLEDRLARVTEALRAEVPTANAGELRAALLELAETSWTDVDDGSEDSLKTYRRYVKKTAEAAIEKTEVAS